MLRFIGSGSAFNTALGNTSAFYQENGNLLLIDCGGSVFGRIKESGLLDGVVNLYVLVTHLHPDHIGSLGDLILYCHYVTKTTTHVVFPQVDELTGLLATLGVSSNAFAAGDTLAIPGIRVDWQAVDHTDDALNSYGCILNIGAKRVYYSGDSRDIPTQILGQLHAGEFSHFYQDTCVAEYDGNVHLPLSRLADLVHPDARHGVYCMHLDEGFPVGRARQLGFQVVCNWSALAALSQDGNT